MSAEESNVAELVKAECEQSFAPTEFVECIDQSDGCGAKLLLTIVSDTFDKVPLIQRHRRVQKTLKEAGFGMDQVHAITIQAWTAEQYKKKQGN
jgi:stress-induced morphogen